MSKPNYHKQVKKQKERAKKARHEEKQQRRTARLSAAGEPSGDGAAVATGAPPEAVSDTTP
jgi:hypothetical protein